MISRREFLLTSAAALAAGQGQRFHLGDQAARLLVPMDDTQQDHLKAYGLTYNALRDGLRGEWLLNYRGGSFLLPDTSEVRRRVCARRASRSSRSMMQPLSAIRAEIASSNMDSVPLEKAPTVAIYKPPASSPWDDAVALAVQYAGIPFTQLWDDELLNDELSKYDWLHLHHEDFTGQFNKLYLNYRGSPWFQEQVTRDMDTVRRHGFTNVPALKKQIADKIRVFVDRGGLLFAMCGATETLDLAIAAHDVDISGVFSDGTPMDPDADAKMDWTRALAFKGAQLEMSPNINSMSDIDGHQVNVPSRKQPLGAVTLFAFSAKFDPVATMLVQNHRTVIPDFYGVTTSFTKATLKPSNVVLAYEEGAPWVKYIHGDYGKGSWTYFGGHDPEDPQHAVGNPETDLALHPNSPGYRLILNNVLFPAAKKKPLKT